MRRTQCILGTLMMEGTRCEGMQVVSKSKIADPGLQLVRRWRPHSYKSFRKEPNAAKALNLIL